MHDPTKEVYDRISFLLNEVEARLDEGYPDEALQIAVQARHLIERSQIDAIDLRVDTHYLMASCHFDLRDIGSALREYDKVRTLDDKDPEIDYWQARALFHSWRFEETQALLQRYQPVPTTRAPALYYFALVSEFMGKHGEADSLFARSEAENPTDYPKPIRLPSDDVQEMLEELVFNLPPDVRKALDRVKIKLTPLPTPSIHASPDFDPLDLGVYRTGEQSIEIFQRNLERVSNDLDDLREELRMTLLNKIGNYLGWDEQNITPHQRSVN